MLSPLWSFEIDHIAPATYLANEVLLREMNRGGLNSHIVRSAIKAQLGDALLTLELVKPNGVELYENSIAVGDMLLFNWLPIFSYRAYQVLLETGCDQAEFIECRLRVLGETPFWFHAPLQSYDVIDFSRSVALHSISLDPPIPFHFVSACLKEEYSSLPPCFRVPAPGHPQVLSELFTLSVLRKAWTAAGLKGASFRQLAQNAA